VKKSVQLTGDHGIGQMVHVVHMSDDAQRLREFYENVLGGVVFMGTEHPNYLPVEDRYATLIMVGDLCVETMAPKLPPDPRKPVARFYDKFGDHLHSVGYKVDDLPGLANRLIERGIYIGKPGGGRLTEADDDTSYFFPSPRDTEGLMVELTRHDMPGDPRDQDMWSSMARLWEHHPMTIRRFEHVTLGVRDLESAVKTYVDIMQAQTVQTGVDADLGARYQTVQLGDCLLQIAEPTDSDTDLARHVEQWGNMIYSLRWQVADPDRAVAWLARHDVRTTRIRDGLVVTDPADTFGAPLYFAAS
jgi:catechol 2,3-dioxygenase-like lactoylglutathione lyase family enzyme